MVKGGRGGREGKDRRSDQMDRSILSLTDPLHSSQRSHQPRPKEAQVVPNLVDERAVLLFEIFVREGQDKMDVEQSDEKSTDDGPRNEVDRFREVAQEQLEPYITDRSQEGQRASSEAAASATGKRQGTHVEYHPPSLDPKSRRSARL